MTPTIRTTRATAIVGIVLALIVGAGTVGAAGPADVSDRTAAVDGDGGVAVTLPEAPDGVQRYNVTVALDSPSDARIENASAGDVKGFQVRSQDSSSITFRAADLQEEVQSGATDVSLGTVALSGADPADAEFSVTTHDFRNDESEQIDPELSVEAAGGSGAGGGGFGGLTETLPGSPIVWALGALGFTLLVGVLLAWRR